MKWSFLLFSSFLCLQAIAQYPATGNKARLGWQTTGDGLVYRGAIGDTTTLDPSGINNAWMLLDTANGNLYAYRAKAWRLVSGGGGGGGLTMPFDSVTFNVNETDASLRELKYSEEKGYLQYGGQDSVQIPILPGIWYVRNDTSVTIPKGTVLRATGTLGASGRIKVKHMIANGSIDAMYILGIAMHDIAVGADGYAMSQGKIRQVNTQAYSEGAVLYADVDTLGGLTQTEPGNGFLKLPIAFVVHSASNGTIAVRVTSGAYMRDLHDAEITSPASNASLYYNAAQGIWRDTGAAVLVADTSAMLTNYINVVDTATMLSSYISNADTSVFARDFQISGTTNYLAKFTGSNAVGNSVIQDNGTNVGISATPSSFKLDINGSTHTTGDFYADRAARSASAGFVSAQTNNRWLAGMISNSGSWHVYDLLRSTSVMTLDSATGNVGIGTASPGYKLSVAKYTSGTTQGEIVQSIIGNTVYSTVGQWAGLSLGTYADKVGIFAYDGYNNFGRNDLVFAVASGGNTNPVTLTDEKMRILNNGNVGIATSSPSRPLHVAGTTAIRIPVGNFAQRGTSGAGDIRVRNDTANLEFHNGTTWQTVINNSDTSVFARDVQISGTANRLAMFTGSNAVGNGPISRQSDTLNFVNDAGYAAFRMVNTSGGSPSSTFAGWPNGTRYIGRFGGTYEGFSFGDNSGASLNSAAMQLTAWAGGGDNYYSTRFRTANNGDFGLFLSPVAVNANPTYSATPNLSIIQSSGNVGINTTSPSRPLHINATTAIRLPVGNFAERGTSGAGDIRVRNDTANLEFHNGTTWQTVINNSDTSVFARDVQISGTANYLPKFTGSNAVGNSAIFDTIGRVGIGTASPTAKLTIRDNLNVLLEINNPNADGRALALARNNTGNYIGFQMGGSNFIGGLLGNRADFYTQGASVVGFYLATNGETPTGGNTPIYIQPGGYFNTPTLTARPGDPGEVSVGGVADNGAYNLQCNGTGVWAAGPYVNGSDARIKENIEEIGSSLPLVMNLRPVTFNYIESFSKDRTTQPGFIAQDLQNVFHGKNYANGIVMQGPEYLSVAYQNLVPLLTKAIQEQQAQIEALKKEIEALKNK